MGPVLAVIPARSGSKGLPGKNIRPLGGLPPIAHSIRCARMCPQIARVVVTTDGEQIRDVARLHGGDAPFLRPAELAADDTPMMPVLAHALAECERLDGHDYGSVLLLDPTSPGRLPEDVSRAVEILGSDPAAVGVVACSQPTFNPFWVGVVQVDGYMRPAFAGESYERRQDVPPFFRINGALYLWRAEHVRAGRGLRDGQHRVLEIPEGRAFSIDDLHEFEVAEALLSTGIVRLPWLESGRA